MLFFGTEVAAGKARAIVVATGPRTELGRIATLIGAAGPESTPLEKRLERLGAALLVVSLAVVGVVFALGLLRGEPIVPMFLTAVSLAVAAIPEGLPAMVTITLALGVTRMARRNALVRRLASVETLGSTTVICTDKTGTLTRGQMAVRALHAAGQPWVPVEAGSPAVRAMLETSVLCNDARVVDEDGTRRIIGDPTEAALLEAALASGVDPGELDARQPVVLEFPFDAERKRMTVLRRSGNGGGFVAHVKGAVDVILPRCTAMAGADGSAVSLDSVAILAANDAFAREALRVLAIARRPMAEVPPNPSDGDIERDLTMLGLVAMEDPLRPEAKPAVEACRSAGIRVVMITGDHRATASSIAAQLGLLGADGVMSGVDLDRVTDAELAAAVSHTAVYARVTAEHKLRIIRAWKSQGAIVAMTGDGVNDAPALKQADVGIAMGITGTDVAKDASDIVVTDDNFASIVAAVEEGRSIYANIQRGLQYLLSCNLSEILLMLLASMLALPLPLLPVQILWTNLVTDGLPALALAVEPGDPDAMRRPPRAANARFLDRHRLVTIARHGFFMAAAPLLAYAWVLQQGAPIARARGLAFSILVFSQLAHAFNSRHERTSIFTLGPLSNRALVLACVSAALMQLAILTFPPLRPIFNVAPLGPVEWGLALGLGALPIAGMELEKWIARRRADRA
jgi:Ca2+-transporting ATPase